MNDFSTIDKKTVCCFTGPRPEKIDVDCEIIKKMLKFAIIDAINQGYCYFITGMSRGFDVLAGNCVIELSEKFDIHLVSVIPFMTQDSSWTEDDQRLHSDILSKSRYVFCLSEKFHRGVYHARNRFMVDNSSKVITYYNNSKGGTKYTLDYAEKNGKKIVNIIEQQISF